MSERKMSTEIAIHCMKAGICEEVCEECQYYGTTGTDHCEEDAIRMAISALGKQIPKKVDTKKRIDTAVAKDKRWNWWCPNCCLENVSKEVPYCFCCGQRLDWEE
jgi:hypothetical protein